jgi:hypothetical protein
LIDAQPGHVSANRFANSRAEHRKDRCRDLARFRRSIRQRRLDVARRAASDIALD